MKRSVRFLHIVAVGILALSLGLSACAPSVVADTVTASVTVDAPATLPAELSVQAVAELLPQGGVTVIDVREPWEYDEGHIADAVLIPLGELAGRLDEIPRDEPVILVCRSSNRSGQAQRLLQRSGFENTHNMLGGMLAWTAAGYATER